MLGISLNIHASMHGSSCAICIVTEFVHECLSPYVGFGMEMQTGQQNFLALTDISETNVSRAPEQNLWRLQWAKQGVLLLNTVLTVRAHAANSHARKGWEAFTDAAIRAISLKREGVVFLLWGKPAEKKSQLINPMRHHVLTSFHPSGLSASRVRPSIHASGQKLHAALAMHACALGTAEKKSLLSNPMRYHMLTSFHHSGLSASRMCPSDNLLDNNDTRSSIHAP